MVCLANQLQASTDSIFKIFLTLNVFLLLSTALSVATGWLYGHAGSYGAELDWHKLSGYIFAGLVCMQFALLLAVRKRASTLLNVAYYLVLLLASGAMVFTSHLGGELVHGKGFVLKAFRQKEQMLPSVASELAIHAPSSVFSNTQSSEAQRLIQQPEIDNMQSDLSSNQNDAKLPNSAEPFTQIEEADDQDLSIESDPFYQFALIDSTASDTNQTQVPEATSTGLDSDALLATDSTAQKDVVKWDQASAELAHKRFNLAARVLKNHCYSCHGATKEKGGLRLDSKEFAMTAGDSGEVSIIPHNAKSSLLITRMLLPQEHDDVMPPSSKARVNANELAALMDWINAGAIWDSDITYVPPK